MIPHKQHHHHFSTNHKAQVMTTEFSDRAFTILQDKATEYDLLVASMDLHDMDCLTFIKKLRTISDIPFVMTSRRMDCELVATIKKQDEGACQFFDKPITRDEARALWQYVRKRRRTRANTINNNSNSNHINYTENPSLKSKGKTKLTHHERKRNSEPPKQRKSKNKKHKEIEEVIPPTGQQAIGMTEFATSTQATGLLQNSNTRNPIGTNVCSEAPTHMQPTSYYEIGGPSTVNNPYAMCESPNFQTLGDISSLLTNNAASSSASGQSDFSFPMIPPTGQQAMGMTELASSTQATGHIQDFNSRTPIGTNINSEAPRHMQPTSYHEIGGPSTGNNPYATCERPNFQTLGAISPIQTNNAASNFASGQSEFMYPNKFPEINTTTYGNMSLPNYATPSDFGKENALMNPSFNSWSHPLVNNSPLDHGKSVTQFGMIEGSSSMRNTSLLSNTNNDIASNQLMNDSLQGRIDQIRRAYRTTNTISGKETSLPNTQAESSENLLLGAKSNWSQFDHVSTEDVSNIAEFVSKRVTSLGTNINPNHGYNYNHNYNYNYNHDYPTQVPFSASENYVQPNIQNSSNLQVDKPAIPKTSEYPTYGFSHSFSRSEGFKTQGVSLGNDFGGTNLEGIRVVDSSADILKNASTSNTQQLNEDDLFLDEILAELRSDFTDDDFRKYGFNTGSGV